MKKLRVGILFGGRSGEHEISLLSAASVFDAIDKNKFEVVPIGITKEGHWVTAADAERLLRGEFSMNPKGSFAPAIRMPLPRPRSWPEARPWLFPPSQRPAAVR